MRPLVKSAMQASSAHVRKAQKAQSKSKSSKDSSDPERQVSEQKPPALSSRKDDIDRPGKTEFAKTSSATPKRLNDIAMEPPSLKKLPRGAQKATAGGGKSNGAVLSMAQKHMMEVERENAIRRYRAMKEAKTGVKRWDADAIQVPEG